MAFFEFLYYGFVGFYCAILALICWGVWRCAKNRKWIVSGSLFVCLLGLIVFPGLSFGILPGSYIYLDLVHTKELTGKSFLLGNAELSEHSERFFNGDGYSIDVYSISENAASELKDPASHFFETYPIRPGYRSHWESSQWKNTPSLKVDEKFIQFAGIGTDVDTDNWDMSNPRHVAARLLHSEGNFYSFFYYMHSDYLGNVDLFIISPKERLFVIVNHNT